MTQDPRPANCRFRLQDEGKPYPRSACTACGASVGRGLGKYCTVSTAAFQTPPSTTNWIEGLPPKDGEFYLIAYIGRTTDKRGYACVRWDEGLEEYRVGKATVKSAQLTTVVRTTVIWAKDTVTHYATFDKLPK